MAGADYYSCDMCGCKTFYDAALPCDNEPMNENPVTEHAWPDGNIGYMVVLCRGCAKKYVVKVELKPEAKDD